MGAFELQSGLYQIFAPEDILEQEPMSKHTTFQVGGPARYFVCPRNAEEVQAVIRLCREEQTPYYILGKGSNLLVSDKGFDGVMIHLPRHFSKMSTEGCRIRAEAGVSLPALSVEAWKHGLGGLEFAAGIPGCVGGGCVMNAGAYGGTLSQVIQEAVVLTREGTVKRLSADRSTGSPL